MCLRWTITEQFAAPDAMVCPSAKSRTFHHTRRKIRQVLEESEPNPYTRTNEPGIIPSTSGYPTGRHA